MLFFSSILKFFFTVIGNRNQTAMFKTILWRLKGTSEKKNILKDRFHKKLANLEHPKRLDFSYSYHSVSNKFVLNNCVVFVSSVRD